MNPGGIPRDFPEEKLCGSIPVEIPDEIATKFLWINFCFFFKQLQEFQQESQYEFLQECKEDLLEEYQVKFTTRIKIFLKEIFSGISGEIQAAVSGEIPAGFQNSLQFFFTVARFKIFDPFRIQRKICSSFVQNKNKISPSKYSG